MDRDAIVESRLRVEARRRERHNAACRESRMRKVLGLPLVEPDDDIPEVEARARFAEVARVKGALVRLNVDSDLTEHELARILD